MDTSSAFGALKEAFFAEGFQCSWRFVLIHFFLFFCHSVFFFFFLSRNFCLLSFCVLSFNCLVAVFLAAPFILQYPGLRRIASSIHVEIYGDTHWA